MSNSVLLNSGHAPFVQDEFDSAETTIYAGHMLELDVNADVIKRDGEPALDAANESGRAIVADVDAFDPDVDKGADLTSGNVGERLRVQFVPVGGKFTARLAAGGDLTDTTRATVDPTTVLEEVALGAVAEHDGAATTGDGTGGAAETVYDAGALYLPLESVDNSGAAAGVDNQVYVEVVRIA